MHPARAVGAHLQRLVDRSPTPTPDGPAGDILLAYLHEHFTALLQEDPRVRIDAHDAVHRMRVTTRRMRSVLATYRSLLTGQETVRLLRDELKWLADVLGRARDAEVMHERLRALLTDEPVDLLLGPVERRVDIELGGDYKKAHTRVLKTLDGRRYVRLLDLLGSLLEDPELTPRGTSPADQVIPKLIKRDTERLRRAVRAAKNHPASIGDHPALHDARKSAKRLRYAAEAASPIGRNKISRLAEAAQEIQKILGDHQDSVVTRILLRRLGAEAFYQGENGFSFGRLHALEQCAAVDAETRFHREWKHFPG